MRRASTVRGLLADGDLLELLELGVDLHERARDRPLPFLLAALQVEEHLHELVVERRQPGAQVVDDHVGLGREGDRGRRAVLRLRTALLPELADREALERPAMATLVTIAVMADELEMDTNGVPAP